VRFYDANRNAAEYCAELIDSLDPNYGFHGFPNSAAALRSREDNAANITREKGPLP
jgi:hypothetical protein